MIGRMSGTDHRHPTCIVMGTELFAGDLDAASQAVIERALSGRGGYASLTGVHGLTLSQRDPGLLHALREAWVNFPDGAPVAWRQRRSGTPNARRIAGPDLMPLVFDAGASTACATTCSARRPPCWSGWRPTCWNGSRAH